MQKPFLKWAGGKTRLCEKINTVLPSGNRLVEPFVGSGAVFMNTEFDDYLLADTNDDIINLYKHLQTEGQQFIDYCKTFFTPANNTQAEYLKNRVVFNATTDIRLKSALFLYLNRHCFNGLCRYNKKGGFNVPFGKYDKPYFPENEMKAFYEKSKIATFINADFKVTMKNSVYGDVCYCDPPYVPLTDTAYFTSYTVGGFNIKDQEDLRDLAITLQEQDVPVLISNHSTDWTLQNYSEAMIVEFDVQRTISAKGDKRTKAKELLALFKKP